MSAIFGFLLIIIVIVLVIGFSIITGILRLLFGFGRKRNYQGGTRSDKTTYQNKEDDTNHNNQTPRKKIFSPDEGEYVDFEEVKDADRK